MKNLRREEGRVSSNLEELNSQIEKLKIRLTFVDKYDQLSKIYADLDSANNKFVAVSVHLGTITDKIARLLDEEKTAATPEGLTVTPFYRK